MNYLENKWGATLDSKMIYINSYVQVKAKGNIRGLIDDKAFIVCQYERLSMM